MELNANLIIETYNIFQGEALDAAEVDENLFGYQVMMV
jgi:hypothetical protein